MANFNNITKKKITEQKKNHFVMNVVQWRVETFTFLSKNRSTTSWNVCFGPFNVAGLMQMNIVGQSKLHRCFPLCFFTRTKRSRWLLVVVMTYLHIVLSSPKHKDTTRRRPLWTEFFKCQFNLTLAVAAHKKKKRRNKKKQQQQPMKMSIKWKDLYFRLVNYWWWWWLIVSFVSFMVPNHCNFFFIFNSL